MNMKVEKSKLIGEINAVCSKSVVHRLLICAALAYGQTSIGGITENADIIATADCLSQIGAKIEKRESAYFVRPIGRFCEDETAIVNSGEGQEQYCIDCNESGSTLRFILPVLGALGVTAEISGKEGLISRPIGELVETLREGGLKIQSNNKSIQKMKNNLLCDRLPLSISGQLVGGEYHISGNISSQYISGLLMALPLLTASSKIITHGEIVSAPYIDITIAAMTEFGVKVEKTTYGYEVFGGQRYVSPRSITVEGDWSNAAFWLVGGALCGKITTLGIMENSTQGDKNIVTILRKLGANIIQTENSVTTERTSDRELIPCGGLQKNMRTGLLGAEIDCRDTPDLIPIVSIAAAMAEGKSAILGVDRLRIKESDRLAAVMEILTDIGIRNSYEKDILYIEGGEMHGAVIDCRNDHRLVMSGAIIGSICGGVTLIGVDAVKKSYPTFFEDFVKLGGKCKII